MLHIELLCKGGGKKWAKASFSYVPRFPSERPRAHKIVLKPVTVRNYEEVSPCGRNVKGIWLDVNAKAAWLF